MRKKSTLFVLSFLTLFFIFFAQQATAQTFPSNIEDSAQILGDSVSTLSQKAQEVAQKTRAGVFVVTTENDISAGDYARTYLADKVGSGNNGVVLVINMNLRKVYIWATGNMKYYLPSSRINATLDVVQPALSDNDNIGAVSVFFDKVEHYYQAGIPTSRKYTVNPETGVITFHRSFQPLNILIAVIVAFIVGGSFVWTIYRRYQMKGSHSIWRYDYGTNGNLELNEQQDVLVNTFITTRRIPRPSSNSGGSSGGGSGGGRSF
ncbi:TPM domain-containing protein [Lactococcus allomyrinae]|uniref:TPM domain-containing protein n=1 Tax=Lactococcus allomyrinae TaxID=2419773 RepID=A0A387BNQ7_9LACT|nr:TPM domain-containing protein [Lactococcus allomyrinae]AYG00151.1 hypothetical protein D7I46_03060 [Lactococcus allomyrinae]